LCWQHEKINLKEDKGWMAETFTEVQEHQPGKDQREAAMDDTTYKFFIMGLRPAIKRAGYKRQADFADGLMNTVSLSRHLNFKMEMQPALREAVVDKLGLEIADVVLLGKALADEAQGLEQIALDTTPAPPDERPVELSRTPPEQGPGPYPDWTAAQLAGWSTEQLSREVQGYMEHARKVQEALMERMLSRGRMIAADRNRAQRERTRYLKILEAIPDAVKVALVDKTVTFRNRRYTELLGQDILGQRCAIFCDDPKNCYHDEVVRSGRPVMTAREWGGRIFTIHSAPLFAADGSVHEVVTVIRAADPATMRVVRQLVVKNDPSFYDEDDPKD